MKVSVGISNRHVHLKKADLDILFGVDYELSCLKYLNQPGQFSCNEQVTIKTEKSEINNVRILGPVRSYTQIEISKTDAYKLGINPPVRTSGDLEGSCGITIVGPKGSIFLKEGCIIADRHIHITKKQQAELGLTGLSQVSLRISGTKGGIINNVHLKVSDEAYVEAHLDTDDANAFLINNGDELEVIL